MNYHWTTCPNCRCEVAINYSESADGRSGSLRRWSHDRTINDGKALRIPGADTEFSVECVCGQRLEVARPDAVSAPRESDLRVTLKD